MPHKVLIRTQADRLPDVTHSDGRRLVQIGLRVSGAIRPDPGVEVAGDLTEIVNDILPWHWLGLPANTVPSDPVDPIETDGSWEPHGGKLSWRLFACQPNADPVEVTKYIEPASKHATGALPIGLFQTIQDDIYDLAANKTSLIVQSQDQAADELTERTVFGLVESLTMLPHPVPAGTEVFAAVSLHRDAAGFPAIDDETFFVGFPRISPASRGKPTLDVLDPFQKSTGGRLQFPADLTGSGLGWDGLYFDSQTTLAMKDMKIGADTERLMDLAMLRISLEAKMQEDEGSEDWAAHLPRNIAEALDPAARVSAVLEPQLRRQRDAIHGKFGTNSRDWDKALGELRALFDSLAATVMTPRTRAATAFRHDLTVFLSDAALQPGATPEQAAEARALLLAHLGEDRKPVDTVIRLGRRPFIAETRVRSALQAPHDDAPDEAADPVKAGISLDAESGFRDFVATHWFGPSSTANERLAAPLLSADTSGETSDLEVALLSDPGLSFQATLADTAVWATLHLGPVIEVSTGVFDVDPVHTVTLNRSAAGAPVTLTFAGNTTAISTVEDTDFTLQIQGVPSEGLNVTATGANGSVTETDQKTPSFPNLFGIAFEGTASLSPTPASGSLAEKLTAETSPSGARESMALAHVAPYLPELLKGRTDWSGGTTYETGNLRKRVIAAGKAFLKHDLTDIWKTTSSGADPWLKTLIDGFIEAAAEDAVTKLSHSIPERDNSRDAFFPVTSESALPLSVRIDQVGGIEDGENLWRRLAGSGFYIARTEHRVSPTNWYSLNAARLSARDRSDDGDLEPVDPVPLPPGEVAGVGQSLIRYENRWLVSALGNDTSLDPAQSKRDAVARRPEKIHAPKDARLPALSYGSDMHVFGYLIGQGGILPVGLRLTPEDPFTPLPTDATVRNKTSHDTVFEDGVFTTRYLRSRSIGTPRITRAKGSTKPVLPPIPDGLDPLAAELPIRPPPFTLTSGTPVPLFRDRGGSVGVLSPDLPRFDGTGGDFKLLASTGFSFEIRGIEKGKPLTVAVFGTKAKTTSPVLIGEFDIPATSIGHRIDLLAGMSDENSHTLTAWLLNEEEPAEKPFSEDRPRFIPPMDATARFTTDGPWNDFFLVLKGNDLTLEAPVAIPVEMPGPDYDPDEILPLTDRILPPETTHKARTIALVHKLRANPQAANFRIRRPSVDFRTFERWVNAGFLTPVSAADKTLFQSFVNDAFRLSVHEPPEEAKNKPDSPLNPAKDFDDPAASGFHIELVRIFPTHETVAAVNKTLFTKGNLAFEGFQKYDVRTQTFRELDDNLFVECDISVSDTESLTFTGQKITVTAKAGELYELRISAIVPETQDGLDSAIMDRLSPAVIGTLCQVPDTANAGQKLWVGPPEVLTIEAATTDMPKAHDANWSKANDAVEFLRPPNYREDIARIRLAGILRGKDAYPTMRFVRDVALLSQRWDWRGRPQSRIGPFKKHHGLDGELADWDATAFSDRRQEDIGAIETRKIDRKHVYDLRDRFNDAMPALSKRPHVIDKPLDWHGGMNLRRFALRLTSRYAAIDPSLVRYTHIDNDNDGNHVDETRWLTLAVPDRPTGRKLNRPAPSLILPLTEGLGHADPTPPLLAILSDTLYSNHNIADDIEAVVETARHPLPSDDGSGIPPLKHWQEIGPDPIRSHRAHDGHPVPIRLDGPVGYGFDLNAEAGLFSSAGILVNTAVKEVEPWSMIKLRMRRFEHPEALFTPSEPADETASNLTRPAHPLAAGDRIGIHVAGPKPAMDPVAGFETWEHEGIFVDIENALSAPEDVNHAITLSFVPTKEPGGLPEPVTITFNRSSDPSQLLVRADTRIGPAGETSFPLAGVRKATLRMVVSHRPKPEGDETWLPAGDVVVKLLLEGGSGSEPGEYGAWNRWLTVVGVPLETPKFDDDSTEVDVTEPVVAYIENRTGRDLSVRPIRLTDFTPGVWCQFTEAMSVFRARFTDDASIDRSELVTTEDLFATLTSTGDDSYRLSIECPRLSEGAAAGGRLDLASAADVAEGAQVEHAIFAILTYFAHDVFDHARERPWAVFRIPDFGEAKTTPTAVLETDFDKAAKVDTLSTKDVVMGRKGRIRLIKVLAPKTGENGGFAMDRLTNLADLFKDGGAETDFLNPMDAAGMVIGISRPVDLKT